MPENLGPASPSAGDEQLSALSPPQFTSYLASAVSQRVIGPECLAELARRGSAKQLRPKDLWLVLMRSGHDSSWSGARRIALDMVEGYPGLAASVLSLQQRYSGGAKIEVELGNEIGIPGTGGVYGPMYVARAYTKVGDARVSPRQGRSGLA